MILLIDNYDSFVHNLARHFQRLGQETLVVRNDTTTPAEVRRLCPQAIVLSPGPCTPTEAGCSLNLVRELHAEVPMLGVCLGHQTIAAAFDATIVRAKEPMHGRTSDVWHEQTNLFREVPSPFTVCRYHSLIVEEASLPAEFVVTARTGDGTIMAIEHRRFPVVGVQFHPEATLTQFGYQLLANFLRMAGIDVNVNPQEIAAKELHLSKNYKPRLPARPVTF
jgi:anthranilate synthase/aminodeoxychorismate synthase-like glutamine amidotransferase